MNGPWGNRLRNARFFSGFLFLFFAFFVTPLFSEDSPPPTEEPKHKLDKVERSFGAGFFRRSGYQTFLEPRVSFVKRKERYSEVIEYSWRPMLIKDMPHKERIDHLRCSINRYYYAGKDKKIFYGGGIGGNVILFNDKLKEYAQARKLHLRDGVNGLARVFAGYKVTDFQFGKATYPVVLRVDAFFSPPYKFGGEIGQAGNQLRLTEVVGGISFSIE